jgi:A1 cistron-splicing factor AAR2
VRQERKKRRRKKKKNMPNPRPTETILLPRLPPRTLVGLDLLSFTSTEQFHGISDLPPGWHFLYTGTTESFSLRCGSWLYVGDITSGTTTSNTTSIARYSALGTSGQIEVRLWKWNEDTESLAPLRSDTDINRLEVMRWKANLGGLRQMGTLFSYKKRERDGDYYEDEEGGGDDSDTVRSDWIKLTNRLSPEILSRILGNPIVDDDDRPSWNINSGSSAAEDAENIPGLSAAEEAEAKAQTTIGEQQLHFLPIDLKRTWREGAIGRERTEAAQDRSWALGDLIRRYSSSSQDEKTGEAQVLGELQFCFLMILTLMNYSCLSQWKRLLSLILTCSSATRERQGFFRDVLQLLRLQLRHCDDVDGGLFEMDGDYDANFLRKLLTDFRQSIQQQQQKQQAGDLRLISAEMDALEEWVRAEYGWELRKDSIMRRGMLQLEDGEQIEMEMSGADEDDETGEYAPVIVEMGDAAEAADEMPMN